MGTNIPRSRIARIGTVNVLVVYCSDFDLLDLSDFEEGSFFGVILKEGVQNSVLEDVTEQAAPLSLFFRILAKQPSGIVVLGRSAQAIEHWIDSVLVGDGSSSNNEMHWCPTLSIEGEPRREFIKLIREFALLALPFERKGSMPVLVVQKDEAEYCAS